jgi:hypothetical protein
VTAADQMPGWGNAPWRIHPGGRMDRHQGPGRGQGHGHGQGHGWHQ